MNLRHTLSAAVFLLATPFAASAQNPLTDSLRWLFERTSGNVVATAELLDDRMYAFRPTPEVRTAAQLIGHIAFSAYQFCSAAAGERNPNTENFEETRTTKAALVEALNGGLAYCRSVYDRTSDANTTQPVNFLGPNTRGGVLAFNSAHIYEHYGNLVTYMRLNGIVPPSSS